MQENEGVVDKNDDLVDVSLRLPVAVVRQLRRRALELSEVRGHLVTWNSLAREALKTAAEVTK